MVYDFVPSFEFSDFVLCLRQAFAVCVSVGSHIFVKLLLFFKFILGFDVFLLVFRNKVSFEFDFLECL